jgi:hypothetical protein
MVLCHKLYKTLNNRQICHLTMHHKSFWSGHENLLLQITMMECKFHIEMEFFPFVVSGKNNY